MRLAAYCRVSTDRAEQRDSLAHQKEFFQEYARKNGHELVRLYADEGITGTSLKKRVEFQKLMDDGKNGLFEQVVVKDISRVARNTVDFLQSIRVLKSYGINVIFLTANMTSLGDSEFILTIFGAMAQEESGNLSKRVKWGKKLNAKKGRVPPQIYGYDRVDNFTLRVDPEEAQIVQDIFCKYRKGLGCNAISRALNEAGTRTRYNCAWNARGVRRVLTNPIYCGRYINNKYEITDFLTGKQVRLPPEEHYHHHRPEWAIVTEEEFRQVQVQMEERRKRYCSISGGNADPRYSSRHLFSTLVKCECCGRSFCRRVYAARTYWECSTRHQLGAKGCENPVKIEESELIGAVSGCLSALAGDRVRFDRAVLAAVEKQRAACGGRPDAEGLEARRRRLLARKERCQELYLGGVIDLAELREKTGKIAAELEGLRAGSEHFAAEQEAGDREVRCRREIGRFLALETAGNADLRRLIDHIGVDRDGTARIVLKMPGDPPDPPSLGHQSIPWTPSF